MIRHPHMPHRRPFLKPILAAPRSRAAIEDAEGCRGRHMLERMCTCSASSHACFPALLCSADPGRRAWRPWRARSPQVLGCFSPRLRASHVPRMARNRACISPCAPQCSQRGWPPRPMSLIYAVYQHVSVLYGKITEMKRNVVAGYWRLRCPPQPDLDTALRPRSSPSWRLSTTGSKLGILRSSR